MKANKSLCLLCKEEETDCKCPGGFKVIYVFGKPMSKEEAAERPSFQEAQATALREAKNIERILKGK